MSSKRLESAVRERLAELRMMIKKGKGQWGHPGYVSDTTWHSWLSAELILQEVLARAGLKDGKE